MKNISIIMTKDDVLIHNQDTRVHMFFGYGDMFKITHTFLNECYRHALITALRWLD